MRSWSRGLDADAGVGDGHSQTLAWSGDSTPARQVRWVVLARRGHRNPPAVRGELDGVAEQVVHDLLELRLVSEQRRQVRGHVEVEADALLVGQRFDDGLHALPAPWRR